MKQSMFTADDRDEIRLFIRACQVKYGLSQVELAAQCDVSRSALRNVEIGQPVTDQTLRKIASVVIPKPKRDAP